MADKTITMSLLEYQNWEMHNKFNLEEIKELREQIEELQNAKAVFIERIVRYDRMGYSRTEESRPRIHGKGVELNKAIQELRNEVDKMYIDYNEREANTRDNFNYVLEQRIKHIKEYETQLHTIQSKWWYKLFSKF